MWDEFSVEIHLYYTKSVSARRNINVMLGTGGSGSQENMEEKYAQPCMEDAETGGPLQWVRPYTLRHPPRVISNSPPFHIARFFLAVFSGCVVSSVCRLSAILYGTLLDMPSFPVPAHRWQPIFFNYNFPITALSRNNGNV